MASLPISLFSVICILSAIPHTAHSFKCAATTRNCKSILAYTPKSNTTLSALKSFLGIKNLRSILGANGLPPTTSPDYIAAANKTIQIPFPCICQNGTGVSNRIPTYTVVKGDSLYNISTITFGGLMTYQEIAAVNGIKNDSLIHIGQKLWIPLPCSCDPVDGQTVVHYVYTVQPGNSVAQIAAEFGTTEQTLLNLNSMANSSQLMAGQTFDVPLRACSSSIKNTSLDYPLLVTNGSYALTAHSCVTCNCDASNNYVLQCGHTNLKPTGWSTCPPTLCGGNLDIGISTGPSVCNESLCSYAGYTTDTILTSLVPKLTSTCPASGDGASSSGAYRIRFGGWSSALALALVHLAVLCFHHCC